jgi:hypothetical protein
MNDEEIRISPKAVIVYFKFGLLSQHSPGQTEEMDEKPQTRKSNNSWYVVVKQIKGAKLRKLRIRAQYFIWGWLDTNQMIYCVA